MYQSVSSRGRRQPLNVMVVVVVVVMIVVMGSVVVVVMMVEVVLGEPMTDTIAPLPSCRLFSRYLYFSDRTKLCPATSQYPPKPPPYTH